MKAKAKDISDEVKEGGLDAVDWKELWADGYDAVIIDGVAKSISRFGPEDEIELASVIL